MILEPSLLASCVSYKESVSFAPENWSMSVNPGLDIRTDAGPPPVLEDEKKTFDQILLEKNIAALFGIGTAYFTYKAHPMTRRLVKNHGWIGFLNVLTVPFV